MKKYRPWGTLNWLLDKAALTSDWDFLGCISTEERSLSAWKQLNYRNELSGYSFLQVNDPPSRFRAELQTRFLDRHAEFEVEGGSQHRIQEIDLLVRHHEVVGSISGFIAGSGENLFLDITSFPKRFFFPFIAQLMKTDNALKKNIFVSYTVPRSYTTEPLSENFGSWAHLPLFGGGYRTDPVELLVVGLGFEAMGLLDELEAKAKIQKMKCLLPFPAPMEASRRSLDLLRRLQEHHSLKASDVFRTAVRSVSDTFDRLLSITQSNSKAAMLAPFGPKTSSLGMAIFATLTESQVFYTQPSLYHPDYTTGVSQVNGIDETYCYAIRLNEVDQFTLDDIK